MWFFTIIPEGEQAVVTRLSGKTEIVYGPKRVFTAFGTEVRFFRRLPIEEGQEGFLVDVEGHYVRIAGPKMIFVDPRNGRWLPDDRYNLATHEAIVVVDEFGTPTLKRGSESPVVFVSARERLMEFVWTGSKGDTGEKSPGSLRIEKLRLNDTQTYLSFRARTRDNVPLSIQLMVFYGYSSPEKLIVRDDPLGAMYNKIISTLVEYIGTLRFDEFKEDTGNKIGNHPLFTSREGDNGLEFFENLGIGIQKVTVLTWEPTDSSVQRVLSQVATIQTQKVLDESVHEQTMAKLANELKEMEERAKLDEQKKTAAQADGEQGATRLHAMYEILKGSVGEQTARQILILAVARDAKQLVVSPEMLNATR